MSDKKKTETTKQTSRRDFIKKSSIMVASGAVASNLNIAQAAHPFGSDTSKIGRVG